MASVKTEPSSSVDSGKRSAPPVPCGDFKAGVPVKVEYAAPEGGSQAAGVPSVAARFKRRRASVLLSDAK